MIKNIIFDLGNVIINFNKEAIIRSFTNDEKEMKYITDEIFNSKEWQMMDLGMLTNCEAAESINKRNNYIYEKLTNDFLDSWYKIQIINEDVVLLAKELKLKGYKLYVLSNIAHKTYEFFENNEFFKLCDGIVISAQEHVKKPDSKIFNALLKRYNLNSCECIFIDDDDTGRSYKTANELGILGRVVAPNNVNDISKMLLEYDVGK